MNTYIYIEKVSLLKTITGNIMLISGIIGLCFINIKLGPELIFIWILLCFIGLFLISTQGFKINFKSRSYMFLNSIYGFHFGFNYNYFPKVSYISLFETTVKQKIGGRGFNPAEATLSGKKVKINFFDEDNRPITIYIANNRSEALEIRKNLQALHTVKIIDNFN
ncbi:hypothetical protein FLGE108171_11110 [Flavobacterium gelidilacus]|uniref:hypothetical protein n=1 Tax=Flavobacterium gelidilacus TaxID=206041 RepID=UPI0003FCF157|nr:hypothetical protein [Flavobacterium gelidilacus]